MKNPNGGEEVKHRSPTEIMDEIAALDAESAEVLSEYQGAAMKNGWETKQLGEVCAKLQMRQATADAHRTQATGISHITERHQ